MGVDHEAKLIVGFSLDYDKVKKWMNENDIEDEDTDLMNNILQEQYKIPEKIYNNKSYSSLSLSIYIKMFGNIYNDQIKYFLTFYECSSINIKDLNNITQEMLDLYKKIYSDIMSEECVCENVGDIPVLSTLYVW